MLQYNIQYSLYITLLIGFPGGSVAKNPPAKEGDTCLIPRLRRSPGKGNGNPCQYSCLGNPMNRGAWWSTSHGVAKELDLETILLIHKNSRSKCIFFKSSFKVKNALTNKSYNISISLSYLQLRKVCPTVNILKRKQ